MRNWAIPIGRIFGVEIRIHLTFLLLVFFVFVDSGSSSVTLGSMGRTAAVVGIIFASVVAHELGHAWMAIRNKVVARAIVLLPLGGVTLLEDPLERPEPARDMRIALAGPVVSLLIAFVAAAVCQILIPGAHVLRPPWVGLYDLAHILVWTNVFVGVFNLLPAYPMDGGRVLRSWFLMRGMDVVRATRRAVSVTQAFAMVLMLGGFAAVFTHPSRSGSWAIMIGTFLFVAAQLEDRSAIFQAILEKMRMSDVMLTDFRTLSPADTLEDALQLALHSLQDDFPVVRGGDMVGVISKSKIVDALRTSGNGYVQAVMNRVFEVAHASDSLASAFRKITARGITMVPVVDAGRLVGIVTLQNLMHSMSLAAESRRLAVKTDE
jgi:Zn-dependent protease/CBS domain-containing protein